MADALYSTGTIEQEPGVDQLCLKVLNNSNVTATATATVFNLDGTKLVFAVRNFTLAANSSAFAFVNIPALGEFEVQFRTSNPQVLRTYRQRRPGLCAIGA